MPNFVDCWNSLKSKGYKHADGSEVLNDQDRASIEARIQEHLRTGLDPIEAAKASVKSHLDEAHAQLQSIYDQVAPKKSPVEGQATPERINETISLLEDSIATKRANNQKVPDSMIQRLGELKAQQKGVESENAIFSNENVPSHPFNSENPVLPIKMDVSQRGLDSLKSRGVEAQKRFDAATAKIRIEKNAANRAELEVERDNMRSALKELGRMERLITSKLSPVSEAGQAPAVAEQPKTEGGIGEKVQKEGQGKEAVLATERVQPPAATSTEPMPPESPEALGAALSEKPRLAGPSNRVLQERAARGEIPQAPESGIGVLKEDLIAQANERYSPERSQLAAQKALRGESNLADEADIVLHEEKLTKAAVDTERAMKANPNDPALQQAHAAAEKAMSDWQHGPVAAIKTAWANKGINLQGATDVDTGTLVGLQKLAWDTGKGDFTPEQRPIMDEAANRVTRAQAEEKASIAKANETVQKVLKPSRYMDLNTLRDSLDATLKSMTC